MNAPAMILRTVLDFRVKDAGNEEQRTLVGIATTPATDRYGERVLPKGAEFTLPLPLLWQHRAGEPVGSVIKATVTEAGIEVEAQLLAAGIDPIADRVWALLKAGAVRGLSIGFMPLETEVGEEGEVSYVRWEWLELSVVTIAANAESEILQIRSPNMTTEAEAPNTEETELKPKGALTPLGKAPAVHTQQRSYSLSRILRKACGDTTVDAGLELEQHAEMARSRKEAPEGILVPLSLFALKTKAHDGITASPDSGKSLVGEDRREDLFLNVDEFFRPPVASALGVMMTSCSEDKLILPRQKKRLTTGWIARDGSAAASADAEFDSISLQPTTLSLLAELRRSLIYATHPQAEALLMNDVRGAIDLGLDTAILAGTGASNQPSGLLTAATAATSITGAMSAANAYDHSRKIRNEVESYLKEADPALKWCLHSMALAVLKKTPAFSGAQTTLIPADSMILADRGIVESYGLPVPAGGPPTTTKGLFGDFSECVACTFGPALEIVVNPWAETQFAKGAALVRALVDFGVAHRDVKRVLKFDTETL